MENSNELRAFTDVMTLYAWQQQTNDPARWQIFADVNFRTARIGAEPEIPVRFRLRLKRVEIKLVLPQSDPLLSLDPNFIARDDGGTGLVREKTTRIDGTEAGKSRKRSLSLSAIWKLLQPALGAENTNNSKTHSAISKEAEEEMFRMQVTGSIASSRIATWEVEARETETLQRSPWDAARPRAVVVDNGHAGRRYGMEAGGIRFEAVCAREDLEIDQVELKDRDWIRTLTESSYRRAQEAAVNQHIRDELQKNGLAAENIEDRYGRIVILDRLITNFDV